TRRSSDLEVYTGVTCFREPDGRILTKHRMTRVTFRPLSDSLIERYIATGEPMDKAGAYGVQGIGAVLIENIEGDFFSVMGLPVGLLFGMLTELAIHPPFDPAARAVGRPRTRKRENTEPFHRNGQRTWRPC